MPVYDAEHIVRLCRIRPFRRSRIASPVSIGRAALVKDIVYLTLQLRSRSSHLRLIVRQEILHTIDFPGNLAIGRIQLACPSSLDAQAILLTFAAFIRIQVKDYLRHIHRKFSLLRRYIGSIL